MHLRYTVETMWDLLMRALMSPKDYIGALKKRELVFDRRIHEYDDVYSFIFKPKEDFCWDAGQHAVFTFPHKKIQGKSWRPFSIASSCHENEIRIGTIVSSQPSDFKRNLMTLVQGDPLHMWGPFGEFHMTEKTHCVVGIAGGIGITPFRSVLYEIANKLMCGPHVHLIYAGKDEKYAYKEEIDRFAESKDVDTFYTSKREDITAELKRCIKKYENRATYFISGSPGMIAGVRKTLTNHGITRIVNDPFKGY